MISRFIFDHYRYGHDLHQPITVDAWRLEDAIEEALKKITHDADTIQLREKVPLILLNEGGCVVPYDPY